jgi:hypothetical protein
VQTSLSLKDSSVSSGLWEAEEQSGSGNKLLEVKLPKAMDLQKEAEEAQMNLVKAIHQAQLTEAKRIAARSLTRLNAGFSSVFSKIAVMLDVGVYQALPLDITLKSDQVDAALAKRSSATHSITHAMAYLANYTLNYTLTASATVFNCIEAVPPGEPKFTWKSEEPLSKDEAFSFDLPAKGKTGNTTETAAFEPMPLPFAMAEKSKDAKAKANCDNCPQCAECLEATSDTMQDAAVDAIEMAMEAEVKRMGATVFQKDPKAEVEFLCKFEKYAIQNHYRASNPLVHPAEHEKPISTDKTATFRSLLQQKRANKVEQCPETPPSIASLDDAAHVAQQEAIEKIFLAQYHEVARSVNRGLVRLQAATDSEGSDTEPKQMKSFDEKKWNGEFHKFLIANPIKRWAWNYKPEKKQEKK